MLHVVLGENVELRLSAKEKAHQVAEKMQAEVVVYGALNFSPEILVQHIHTATDLFGRKAVVIVESVCDEGHEEALAALVPALSKTEVPFYILERAVSAPTRKLFEKNAASFEEPAKEKKGKPMGAFAFAQAFADKKRAESWVRYQEALLSGEAAEALHGILFWKVKEMYKSQKGRTKQELSVMLGDLAELPARTRARSVELSYALERFILER